jgi:hypothetical protein
MPTIDGNAKVQAKQLFRFSYEPCAKAIQSSIQRAAGRPENRREELQGFAGQAPWVIYGRLAK